MKSFCFQSLALRAVACWTIVATSAVAYGQNNEALISFRDAAQFQNNGAFQLAIEEWEKYLKNFPQEDNVNDARYYLGVCYMQTGKIEKTLATLEDVVKNAKPDFKLLEDAYLNLGSGYYGQAQKGTEGAYEKAANNYATLVGKFPKGKYADQALYYQGESLYAVGKKDEAVKAYQALVDGHKESKLRADGLYALGVTQEELKDHAAAGQVFDTFLAEFADHTYTNEVRMRKAETLVHAEKIADAEKIFAEVAAVDGFNFADHAMYRQGYCAVTQQKFAEAAGIYAAIPAKFAESQYVKDASLAAARAYYRAANYPEAKTWFEKVLGFEGAEAPEAAHWISRILLRDQKFSEAADMAANLLPKAQDSPFFVNLKMDQADALYEQPEQRAKALDLFLAVAADHADHQLAPQALYNASYASLDLQKYEDGLKHANSYLAKHSEHSLAADVKHVAAECSLLLQKHEDAEKFYRDLTTNHTTHLETEKWHVRLGLTLFLQKKYEDTVKTLTPLVDMQVATNDRFGQFHFAHHRQSGSSVFRFVQSSRTKAPIREWTYGRRKIKGSYHKTTADKLYIRSGGKLLVLRMSSLSADDKKYIRDYKAGKTSGSSSPNQTTQTPTIKPNTTSNNTQTNPTPKVTASDNVPSAPFKGKIVTPVLKAEALYLIGTSHYHLNNYDDATKALKASLVSNASWRKADETTLNLARSQRRSGQHEAAIGTLKKLFADYPESSFMDRAHFRMAQSSYDLKDYKTAAEEYKLVTMNWPQSVLVPHAHFGKGWAELLQQDYEAGDKSFTALISGFADHQLIPQAHRDRAVCRQRIGNFAGGVEDVNEYLKSNPEQGDKSDSLYVRGLCEVGLKQHEASTKTFETILKDNPEFPRAAQLRYEMAWSYHGLENKEAAVEQFKKLTEDHADSPLAAEAFYHVGRSQYEAKEYEPAMKSFATGKGKAGTSNLGERLTYMLAWSHYKQGDQEGALKEFSEQVENYSDGAHSSDGKFMKAECLFKLEKYADALPAYTAAKAAPNLKALHEERIMLHAAQCAWQTEKWNDSLTWLKDFRTKFPDSPVLAEALLVQGIANQNLNKLDDALKQYSEATAKSRYEVGAHARFRMGEVQVMKKDFSAAVKEYQRVMYGYGADNATDEIKKWQAKCGYMAGYTTSILAGQAKSDTDKQQLIDKAKKFYSYVVDKHSNDEYAKRAADKLKALN